MSKTKAKIKIGFDMDGVLLENPSRIFRSLISRSKKAHLFPRKELEFYHPETALEKWLWLLVHKSSFRLAPGFTELERLHAAGKIELYVVSARFACLDSDTRKWVKRLNQNQIFKQLYFNEQDEQPHLFKLRLVKKLQLDYFVEDNWDVASFLAVEQTQTEVWWLSNLLDRGINYPHKFFSFQVVVSKIKDFLV
jgi:hypothetical protein